MRSRFKQSAPPSLDRLYRDLPVGPFGVPPMLKPVRAWKPVRKAKAGPEHHRFLSLISMLRRLATRAGLPMAPSRQTNTIGSAACCP